MKKIVLSLVTACGILSANNQVEINMNSDTLEIEGSYYLNDIYEVSNEANYYITASYLGNEEESVKKKLISTGLKLLNPYTNEYGFSFGLGCKLVIADDIGKSFLALPLNIHAKYEFDDMVHFDAEYGYAPKTLTFSDGDGYRDYKVTANYKLLENGYAFTGVRGIETSYTKYEDVKYDTSLFFGYKVRF